MARRASRPFPLGTLVVNLSGAALLGFLGGLALSREAALRLQHPGRKGGVGADERGAGQQRRLPAQRLGEERQLRAALANVVVSVVLGGAAAFIGQQLAQFV
ncbi:hypothetical protein MAHJHV54_49460 [Mycobacterium avium subsp. hominissuis]